MKTLNKEARRLARIDKEFDLIEGIRKDLAKTIRKIILEDTLIELVISEAIKKAKQR